jgi:hypothetical protein
MAQGAADAGSKAIRAGPWFTGFVGEQVSSCSARNIPTPSRLWGRSLQGFGNIGVLPCGFFN